MPFPIHRGTNISHWLSQSGRRGAERRAWFTEADVRRLADLGFDHLRLPIDEEQMWDESGGRNAEAFDLLDAALDWAETAGLRAIVDLHILRSHYFNDRNEPRLYREPAEAARFCDLWRDLAQRLHPRSTDRVAYELLNEAVARDPADWNRVAMAALEAVREREPERAVVLGSNRFGSCDTFDDLAVPEDPNVILTFHYYRPMLITHYRASWWEGGVYEGPIRYPGLQVAPEDIAPLPPELRAKMTQWNTPFSRERIVADLAKPLAVRQRTGRPLYCGEFGVRTIVPLEIRRAWTRDIVSTFEAHGIGWATWDYKGAFGLVAEDGRETGITDVLLGRRAT